VVEERPGTCPAVRAQPLVVGNPGVEVGLAGEHRRRLLRQHVCRAPHRVAAADPAGVVADDVEPAVEVRDERAAVGQHPVDAGVARPARHVHQRADPLGRLGGAQAYQREVDPGAARVGPVHRHRHGAALGRGVLGAGRPRDAGRARTGRHDAIREQEHDGQARRDRSACQLRHGSNLAHGSAPPHRSHDGNRDATSVVRRASCPVSPMRAPRARRQGWSRRTRRSRSPEPGWRRRSRANASRWLDQVAGTAHGEPIA
jgi:hypothetical protein